MPTVEGQVEMQQGIEHRGERTPTPVMAQTMGLKALLITEVGVFDYELLELTVRGAVLTGGPWLEEGMLCEIVLALPGGEGVRLRARILNHGRTSRGVPSMGVVLHHETDETEDRIQAALLRQLERAYARRVMVLSGGNKVSAVGLGASLRMGGLVTTGAFGGT